MLYLLVAPLIINAQDKKQEVEKKIKASEMPESALRILEPFLSSAHRIKFYKESDIGHESYECKFKLNNDRYSIEFDTQGQIEDIEIMVSLDEVNADARNNIINYLESHKKYRIRRLQLQFTTAGLTQEQLLNRVITKGNRTEPFHEMVVSIKEAEGWITYEILFDKNGTYLSRKTVIERQTDNVLY